VRYNSTVECVSNLYTFYFFVLMNISPVAAIEELSSAAAYATQFLAEEEDLYDFLYFSPVPPLKTRYSSRDTLDLNRPGDE